MFLELYMKEESNVIPAFMSIYPVTRLVSVIFFSWQPSRENILPPSQITKWEQFYNTMLQFLYLVFSTTKQSKYWWGNTLFFLCQWLLNISIYISQTPLQLLYCRLAYSYIWDLRTEPGLSRRMLWT